MKLFDIDWHPSIQRLSVWQRLSAPARLAFAQMQPSQLQPLAKFNGEHYLLPGGIGLHDPGTRQQEAPRQQGLLAFRGHDPTDGQ